MSLNRGTVLEVQIEEMISDRDHLAATISTSYEQWVMAREGKRAEWKELRNYLFATSTEDTSNSSLPWKNKTVTPKLTQIRDNLHANYVSALFAQDKWFKWMGQEPSAELKAQRTTIETYMENKLRMGGFAKTASDLLFAKTASDLLYDYIDYGNVIADVEFVKEGHKDPVTGGEVVTFVGPKAVRVSPLEQVFNPLASSYEDSPKITRSMVSIGELVKQGELYPERQYDPEVLSQVSDLRTHYSYYDHSDDSKNDAYVIDGFGSLMEYYQSGYVEVLEFEGTIHDEGGDFLENKIITIVDRRKVLRMVDNPSWTGKSTKVHASWRPRPDNLWGMGPLDNLVGMQYRIDHLENIKADLFDLVAHPPLKIRGNVEEFEWAPFAEIVLMDEQSDVETLKVDTTALTADTQIDILERRMEEMAGAPREAMGMRSPGEKTAFEVQSLENAASRIFQEKLQQFEMLVLEPLLNNMLEVARRNMDAGDVIRIMDNDIGAVEFMAITKEDITSKGHLYPMGSRHYAATNQLIQNLNGVFNSQIAQIIAPHVSSKALARMVEDAFKWEKYGLISDNIAVSEQQETASLAQQGQEQVQNEGMTPSMGEAEVPLDEQPPA